MSCFYKPNPIPKCVDEIIIGTITPLTDVDIIVRYSSGKAVKHSVTSDALGELSFSPITLESKQELHVIESEKFIGNYVSVSIGADPYVGPFILETIPVFDTLNEPITYASVTLSI